MFNVDPLQGGGRTVAVFPEHLSLQTGSDYFIIFEGSQWRHVAKARAADSSSLQIPVAGELRRDPFDKSPNE